MAEKDKAPEPQPEPQQPENPERATPPPGAAVPAQWRGLDAPDVEKRG